MQYVYFQLEYFIFKTEDQDSNKLWQNQELNQEYHFKSIEFFVDIYKVDPQSASKTNATSREKGFPCHNQTNYP